VERSSWSVSADVIVGLLVAAVTVEYHHYVAEMAVACDLQLQQFAAGCRDCAALRQELLRLDVARQQSSESLFVGHKMGIIADVSVSS